MDRYTSVPSSTATDFYIYVVRARRVPQTELQREHRCFVEKMRGKATREVEGNNDEAHPERGEEVSPALPSLL